MGFLGVINVGLFMGNHRLERLMGNLICMFMKLCGYKVVVFKTPKFMCNPISMVFAYFLRVSRLSPFV